jgi:L-asparaginase
MKRILLLHTGGTFGMMPIKPSQTLAPSDIRNRIFANVPEIRNIADIDFKIAFNIDSADMQIHHWKKLADIIHNKYHHYDGFVIIHGTDSMVYTACALSFIFRNLNKPIILTGSQRPLAQIRTDARTNLINSLELATQGIPEVAIFFDTHLYRGNRTIKISSTHYDAFDSPNFPPLAEVGLDISLSHNHLSKGKELVYSDKFDSRVFCFQFNPGLNPAFLESLIDSPIRAVIIKALGTGNLAIRENSFIPWIEKMAAAGKYVVLSSQSPYGRIDLNLYENGKQVLEAGGLSSGDMTTPATVVKLMFLLAQLGENEDAVKSGLLKSLAGEVTPSKNLKNNSGNLNNS